MRTATTGSVSLRADEILTAFLELEISFSRNPA
jgi:hypothetical protein